MFRTKLKYGLLPKNLTHTMRTTTSTLLQQRIKTKSPVRAALPLVSPAAAPPSSVALCPPPPKPFSLLSADTRGGGFWRGAAASPASPTAAAAAFFTLWRRTSEPAGCLHNNHPHHHPDSTHHTRMMLNSTPSVAKRFMQVRGKEGAKPSEEENNNKNDDDNNNNNSEKKKEGGEEEEAAGKEKAEGEDENANKQTGSKKKKKKQQAPPKKKTIMDHIRGLRNDYHTFPDIYNSANLVNFIVFTVFCLCSTGSNSEEAWWLSQWGLDETFKPWTWPLHSFLTNNFLSMTYAMMLLHTMCHAVQPTIGSQNLLLFVLATATLSGALMWASEAAYYYYQNHYARHPAAADGDDAAAQEQKHKKRFGSAEKQFGPWDVVAALFVMEYTLYKVSPITILNSFNGWVRYACWVGELCILYFDWQPTLAGTLVGCALIKGVPRFRGVKVAAAGGK